MVSSGPHQIRIGNREFKQILTEVRKLWGQPFTGPRGVWDQSFERIKAPISPPPARQSSALNPRSPTVKVTIDLSSHLTRLKAQPSLSILVFDSSRFNQISKMVNFFASL